RNVVIAMAAGNNTATTAVEAEAVRNAQQIAKAMEGFYGKAGAEQLFELLAGHYGAVKQFATANLANDTALQDTAREAMLSNAGKLAVFLSAANPYLPIDAVRGMLLAHGGHHITQIMQLSSKNYAGEMQTWGEMKNHMYAIADAVTSALAMQFPEKFK
ncbi:MAG: hypothetical protein HYR68_09385, partial [Burkholderiales bacterium]|nr:hypothetical protein [Burkholderiales bacterium]